MTRREPSVRSRLVLLVLAVLVPAALIATSGAVWAWRTGLLATERDLASRSRALAADVARELDSAKGILLALATSPSLVAGDLRDFHRQMVLAPKPPGARITLIDPSGQMQIATSAPYGAALPRWGDVGAVDQVFATGQPQVSDLHASALTPDAPLVMVNVPVETSGQLAYVLGMSLEPAVLIQLLGRAQVPEGWIASIVDSKGAIVARFPDRPGIVGSRVRDSTFMALAQAESLFSSVSRDGFPLLSASARVPGTGWFVALGTRRDVIEAALLRSLAGTVAGGAALLTLGLMVAARIARRIARSLDALAVSAGALGAGAPVPAPVPAGVREASQAGAALARASDALRQRGQERDAAEAARRRGEARLARLLATTPAGVIELDAGGRMAYANPAAERILGAEPGGLVGGRYDDPAWRNRRSGGAAIPPSRLPAALALGGESVLDFEQMLTTRDGRQAVILVDIVPVRDADGQIEGALAAFQDVTARHAAMKALRDSKERLRAGEERFRLLTDLAPAIVWSAQPDGTVSYFNQYWYDYTRWTPEQSLPHGWTGCVHPEDREALMAAWQDARTREVLMETEARLRRHDGAYRWFLMRAQPLRAAPDALVAGWLGSNSDIDDRKRAEQALQDLNSELERRVEARTAELSDALDRLHQVALERERAEDALRQAQKMEAVGQLTGGIAHDFNNMLQAIGGSLDLMQRRIEQGRANEVTRFVESAQKTVGRAAALTNRLLAFARRQALQPRPVVADNLIQGMAELIQQTAGPSVTLDLRLHDGVWSVLCDPNQLENALLNLAINARDAMPGGGRLTVSTEDVRLPGTDTGGQDGAQPGDYVAIMVADTGTGMDDATRTRVFEPFFTTKPIGQGTGLGLSQVYGFVQQSGGFVRLDSAPGQGTAVRLYLPRHEPAHAQGDTHPAHPAPEGADAGETVLLVEDEDNVRSVTAEHLRELGYSVLEAADGAAALRLLDPAARVDVLVTDVGLPGGLNGRQVADAARERRPGLPVLFITGYAGSVLEQQLGPGMGLIGKPFQLDALSAKLRAMLETVAAR